MTAYILFVIATVICATGMAMACLARTGPQSTLASLLVAVGILLAFVGAAFARDDGRYANSVLKPWFDSLRSGKGPCCSDADGNVVKDADWESRDGHYRVRVPRWQTEIDGRPNELVWVEVPEDAVITESNRAGRTMVWPTYGYQGLQIRCFMPGPMT